MKWILIILVACVMISTPAVADITLPWNTNPYGTYQQWELNTAVNVIDDTEPYYIDLGPILPNVNENNYGTPQAYFYLMGKQVNSPGWYSSIVNHQGVMYGCDVWVNLYIPNTLNPNYYKQLEIEVEFKGEFVPDEYTRITPYGNNPVTNLTWEEITETDDWKELTIRCEIHPQPYDEWIYLYFKDSEAAAIDTIEVATVCVPIPAPVAILLGSIGVSLVGWLRRRKTL